MSSERAAVWCRGSSPSVVWDWQAEWRITLLCWVNKVKVNYITARTSVPDRSENWKVIVELFRIDRKLNRRHTWLLFTRRNSWKNYQERKELQNCFLHAVLIYPFSWKIWGISEVKKVTYSTLLSLPTFVFLLMLSRSFITISNGKKKERKKVWKKSKSTSA